MFAQVIELREIKSDTENTIENTMAYFISSLKSNGQILFEHKTAKVDNGYDLYVTTPKIDSLDTRYDSIYVKRDRDLLSKLATINIRQIGIDADSQEYCSCKTRTAMEMETFCNDIDSVFTCCACGKPIALYELPYLNNQNDRWSIVNWQNTFRATHTLWLDSLSDRFTGNQLVNVNSALNKIGREIANEMSEKAGCDCYYNVFDDLTKKVKFVKVNGETVRLCPSCGNAMNHIKFCEDYERYVCEECKLSSDLPTMDPLE